MIQITSRERFLAAGLTLAVGAWALYGLALRPAADRIRTLERILPERQTQLQQLQAQALQYRQLQEDLAQVRTQMASQPSDFQLLPFLETLINRHKLAAHVVAMGRDTLQPQPDLAEMVVMIELREVSLGELVNFLGDVQNSMSVARIGTLHIRKSPKNEALLDSTVGICSPKLSEPALAAHTAQ